MSTVATTVIDAHQHFWDPEAADYPWMNGAYLALRRAYGPSHLAPLLENNGVTATIVVQARQDLDETNSLLDLAGTTPWVAGVVGWVDLTSPDVAETIARVRDGDNGDRLVGIRHLVHDEPDPEWLLRDEVLGGLGVVAEAGLVYDLLVRARELPAATEVARRLPGLRLVLDHLAKPSISTQQIEPWASAIGEIAGLPNVTCKVSGLVTEAEWSAWSQADLMPYVAMAVELFGADRLMWGSDWPVCTLAAGYSEVYDVTTEILSDLVGDELGWILGGCAATTYGLEP
ncbi:MAG TPA: amidohydrolase family protein [Acidimicrobiia bacterium]|nr:amidohydrolase family protein [Acidimicrobiia bacterium]